MDNSHPGDQVTSEDQPQAVEAPGEDHRASVELKLDAILEQLKQLTRLRQHRDFSLVRLIAAVSQLLVVGLLFWTVVGAIQLSQLDPAGETTLKLLAAILLQLVALTLFVLDRQDR